MSSLGTFYCLPTHSPLTPSRVFWVCVPRVHHAGLSCSRQHLEFPTTNHPVSLLYSIIRFLMTGLCYFSLNSQCLQRIWNTAWQFFSSKAKNNNYLLQSHTLVVYTHYVVCHLHVKNQYPPFLDE